MPPSNLPPESVVESAFVRPPYRPRRRHRSRFLPTLAIALMLGMAGAGVLKLYLPDLPLPEFSRRVDSPPLAMKGGDPYLRALMRTISASESNTPQPYHVLYGGQHIGDLHEHPNQCIPIASGPNRGNCTTAAGRYQFLNSTWAEKAQKYHPNPQNFLLWHRYSFEPEYQDRVLYRWLADNAAWAMDLRKALRAGKIRPVLKRLSGTWTSLSGGIEPNLMTPHLPSLYQQFLREELQLAASHPHPTPKAESPKPH